MPLTKAGLEKILNKIPAAEVTNFEREYTARHNLYINIGCNKVVATKVDKFFKIAMQHNVEILDVHIHEWPHVPWLPETQGTFGGYIQVIVKQPDSHAFLHEVIAKLPMTNYYLTNERRLEDI